MKAGGTVLLYLCLMLRLAVLLHHGRSDQEIPDIYLVAVRPDHWQLKLVDDNQHWPLLEADLNDEQVQFGHWGIRLDIDAQMPEHDVVKA